MWKSLRLRPVLASVLVLATSLVHAVTSSGIGEGDGYCSPYNYASHATLTITNYSGSAQANFPVYLKISEKLIPGFHYADVRGGTDDIVFFDSTGRVLDYELEGGEWNTSGETRMWMSIPGFRDGETVTMAWNLRDGCTAPKPVQSARIWSDYIGVWHMDEEIDDAGAKARTPSVDITGHGYDLEPRIGSEGVYYTLTSADGMFGRSRTIDTKSRNKKQGAYLEMSNSSNLVLKGVFTMSFWIKFDGYANYPQLMSRRSATSNYKGFQVDMSSSDRKQIIARGDTQTGSYHQVVDKPFADMGFVHLAFVYNGEKVSIYANGVCKVDEMTIGATTDNGLPICFGNQNGGTDQSVWGEYDEIRFYKGVKSADWIAAEYATRPNGTLWHYGAVTNDADAILKNGWTVEPSVTKTTWNADDLADRPTLADFDPGTPSHGTSVIRFYNKTTGAELGDIVPQSPGEYRAVITVDESRDAGARWGALERTIDFRIVSNRGRHDLGVNVDRVLLMNDDYSVEGGEVMWQAYGDEGAGSATRFWRHLDADGKDASTTAYGEYWSDSPYYNYGGGTHHQYFSIVGGVTNRLWDLNHVRFGNTFNNGEDIRPERDDEGLHAEQNYLPWNPESQRSPEDYGDAVGAYHRYASHIVMQNALNAAVASSMFTNGIGTVYFDAVNGWADNVRGADGAPNYELVVEVATNCVGTTLPPTDERISSNPGSANPYDPFLYADWRRVPVRVLRMNGTACTDLGTSDSVVLDVTAGGSYTNFYRVIAPIGVRGNARFRIRRVAIDRDQSLSPDGFAFLLVDNVICSTPADHVELAPYGRYDAAKAGHEVQGWGGAFVPAFPAAGDVVRGRAKAAMANGGAVPDGTISSATMHYRWHYIDQKVSPWRLADLDPATLVSRRALELPGPEGDIEFWFDLTQVGNFYEYADYSGTGLKLKDCGYSEAITSVTNRAPNYAAQDWFVRLREGKSSYAEMALMVKTRVDAAPQEVGLWVTGKNTWRGFYKMKEALGEGFWWRIEPRDAQSDGAREWNASTNYWYVTDWTEKLPTFPATGRMSEGTTNSWCRMACDKLTGYLMFQVDESTRGVTVIHADYQDFNDWNSPNEYFSGSSAETNEMHGTSSEVKTYGEVFKGLEDTPATSDLWRTKFLEDVQIGQGDYVGYKSFSGYDKGEGWNLGKGMWVYGKYREPESHVAYQAAGCGEGFADFVPTGSIRADRLPRGIGSVSFNARLAQVVAPEKASFYDDGNRLTNYTFLARTCFDMKKNEGFSGNAALSLFAYYRERVGMYEVRWEQIAGKQTKNPAYPTEYLGPQANGQRLVISRWDAVGDTYQETVLHAVTNSVQKDWGFDMPVMSGGVTNNLMPFCISVFKEGGSTVVAAGVRINKDQRVSWNPSSPSTSDLGEHWYYAFATDKSDKQLKSGSYGVLTSNSEGLMLTPQYRAGPALPTGITAAVLVSKGQGDYPDKRLNSVAGFTDCYADIVDGWWSVNPGRQKAIYGSSRTDGPYGFAYVAESQTVDVYAKPSGETSWPAEPIGRVTISNFGTPYNQPDVVRNLYYTEDCELRFKTGGGLDDYRRDVAIADIAITQWRGTEWWSTYGTDWKTYDAQRDVAMDEPNNANLFGNTNIVFTSGWVTNGAVRLSAKRTTAGTASSVRSPLFDGLSQGTGEKRIFRGVGLGMFSFRYREPTANIRLKVQVCTNEFDSTSPTWLRDLSRSVDETGGELGQSCWTTLTNLTYATLMDAEHWDAEKKEGSWTLRLGWHGVKGLMRVVIDDELTQAVANETNPAKFGEIDILEAACKDEPALDKGCWWGWNLKTVGDANDSVRRMYLADYSPYLQYLGQSMALNNSVKEGTNPAEDPAEFAKHLPFVQSPSFTNALIGQISFKARKYDVSERAPAGKVVVYGARKNPDFIPTDDGWTKLDEFDITNTVYETFTCKTQSERYYALRLAVLIDGTESPPEAPGANPQRVLLDEVVVSEAVSAMLSFRNVGAFRTGLRTTEYVEGVTTKEQQPLCDENWGIQAEVFATMLEDEICTESNAVVTLHWYEGAQPWGYENWKERATGHAQLGSVDGSNFVYRSSYDRAPNAVMPAQREPGTIVQYMLEVAYWTVHLDKEGKKTVLPATNWLDSVAWQTPAWYAPLDYNADPKYGAGRTFAGYTILDTVAPGWAWINEVNILGALKTSGGNAEEDFQYAEVCAPLEADLTGWRLRFLEVALNDDIVKTNNLATFGSGKLAATKALNVASNMVFYSIGTRYGDKLKKANGSLDAPWSFSTITDIFRQHDDGYDYVYNTEIPFGVQLVRPSGIIEHSVVVMGTNRWGRAGRSIYDPTNIVARLNRCVPGSRFFYAGEDCHGTFRSDSVIDGQGESAEHWVNDWWCSPGFINTNGLGKVQQIRQHPVPAGDTLLIYARVDRSGGPIRQRVGGEGSAATNDFELIILKKGSETGTNIVYTVEPWYEVAGVTTNGGPFWVPGPAATRELRVDVGAYASNNIEITASAMTDRVLARDYGLTADNIYREAILAWLRGGATLKRSFDNNGTICLADVVGMDGSVITNLSLTTMYWLDMDPTVSNQILQAGMTGCPQPRPIEEGVTNVRMSVFMMITNRIDGKISPYVLRGLEPGSTTSDYRPGTSVWTSETFKVTGILVNGLTSRYNRDHWIPLRWFVFDEDSFYQPGNAEGKEPFTADIEIIDPLTESSPGAQAGWFDWCQKHGYTPFYNAWYIDNRLPPTSPELLRPENHYE